MTRVNAVSALDIPWASEPGLRGSDASGWRLLDDVELMSLPDPQWSIDGMFPDEGVAVIYGPPGSCKTTFAAALLGSLAAHLDFFGRPVLSGGPCAYGAAEDPSGWKVRLAAWKLAHHVSAQRAIGVHTFPEPLDLRDAELVGRFERFLSRALPNLRGLVIDTYAASMPGANENSSEDTTTAVTNARRLQAAFRCLVVLVHHTNASGSRERGHTSLRGGVDTMVSLTPVDDLVHVECSKQRNGPPFAPFSLKLVPVPDAAGCVLRLANEVLPSSALTVTQRKALVTLRENFGTDGATKTEWQRACQDVAERSFHRASKLLLDAALVQRVGSQYRVTERGHSCS